MIKVEDFHKYYGDVHAVEGLSFSLEAGQILGLLGPNGAGKTTTLRALSGIISPTSGTLSIAGHDIVNDSVNAKKALAFVPDDPKLFESLTIWEHIQFAAKTYGVKEYESKGAELLDRFDLTEKRDVLTQELSRGMRQKVAIICAYLHDPTVLLLDEPLMGLDPRGIRTMKDSIVERANQGSAVILSSHQLELIDDLCTHLLIIHRGKQLKAGSMDEVRGIIAQEGEVASLEDFFFKVTEEDLETEVVCE